VGFLDANHGVVSLFLLFLQEIISEGRFFAAEILG
jgi:hypothetical protein